MYLNRQQKKKVCGGKRTRLQRDVDTNFCIDLYIKGYAIREIHRKLLDNLEERNMDYSVSFQQVFSDIKSAMIDWKRENTDMIDSFVTLELAKLDKIEKELWESWERSKNGRRKTEIEGGNLTNGSVRGGNLKKRVLETGDGDPRYLDLLLKVYERRAKLLGYNAPVKLDVCSVPPKEEAPAGTKYDANTLPIEMLVDIAYKLQDEEYKRRQEESNNGQETDSATE